MPFIIIEVDIATAYMGGLVIIPRPVIVQPATADPTVTTDAKTTRRTHTTQIMVGQCTPRLRFIARLTGDTRLQLLAVIREVVMEKRPLCLRPKEVVGRLRPLIAPSGPSRGPRLTL